MTHFSEELRKILDSYYNESTSRTNLYKYSIGSPNRIYYMSEMKNLSGQTISTITELIKGIVPSFDGKIWRLHGKNGKIIFKIEKDKLIKSQEVKGWK